MKLFKSKEERRIERKLQVQKTLGMYTRQIKTLSQQEQKYLETARDAKRVGAEQQCELAKKALKQTMVQRKRLEQSLLTLKIAVQMKDQAEMHAEFAKALKGVSKTIADMFGSTDMVQTQKDFETAMSRAHTMDERVDLFLSSASGTMLGESVTADELVSDDEIDHLISGEAVEAEQGIDAEIDEGLSEIRKELGQNE